MKLVAIDFETANSSNGSACAIGVTVFEEGILLAQFSQLIKPHFLMGAFDYRNIAIHGITPKMVTDEKEWDEVFCMLEPYLEDSMFVAHNAAFDMGVLKSICGLYQLQLPTLQYFCTVECSRKIFPFLDSHRLNKVAEHLSIQLDHHDAGSDARACALIVVNSMNLMGEYDIEKFVERCGCKIKKLK